jgi:hypothetical protein
MSDNKDAQNIKTVYISGPITGKKDFNTHAFIFAESNLQEKGYLTINPLRINGVIDQDDHILQTQEQHDKIPRKAYLKNDIAHLIKCDHIYYLSGASESKGCTFEKMVADELGISELKI